MADIQKIDLQQLSDLRNNIYHKRLFIKCSPKEFSTLVRSKGERIFRENGEDKEFNIDNDNKEVFNQLYFYAIGSDKFKGDLLKGLWLWSSEFGTGKTTMLRIMQELFNDFNRKMFRFIECKTLHEVYLKLGIEYFRKRTLYFDDIGREMKLINDFGNKIKPIPTIIHLREFSGAWTHATAQRPIEKATNENGEMKTIFIDMYGKVSTNRMTKMFNEIEIKGKTRRK
jgi:hypothetical protein